MDMLQHHGRLLSLIHILCTLPIHVVDGHRLRSGNQVMSVAACKDVLAAWQRPRPDALTAALPVEHGTDVKRAAYSGGGGVRGAGVRHRAHAQGAAAWARRSRSAHRRRTTPHTSRRADAASLRCGHLSSRAAALPARSTSTAPLSPPTATSSTVIPRPRSCTTRTCMRAARGPEGRTTEAFGDGR